MDYLMIVLIVILLGGFIGFFYFFNRKFKKIEKPKNDQSIMMLQGQLGELRQNMQLINQNITEKLGKLDKTNQKIVDFSSQLQNLQDILKNPKQRGVLGEIFLETVLKNVLPVGTYQMQYKLGRDSNTNKELIVDAAIFVKDKIIPIDAKFSLENYNRLIKEHNSEKYAELKKLFKRDLKNRIDETAKYILPEKKTYDFAFMFIPAEAIYYDLLAGRVGDGLVGSYNLIEYAFKQKHVIIVSPTTLLAYLQMVLEGLRSLQIEESAKEIKKNVENLGKHIAKYDSFLQKLGQKLGATVNIYNIAYREFGKIDKDITKISSKTGKVHPLPIEGPEKSK